MILELSSNIPVRFLCRHFGVSSSSYYLWRKDIQPDRLRKKEDLCKEIKNIFIMSKGTYGSPRIYQELRHNGYVVSENTVAKYMAEMALDARLKKKYRIRTTDSNHSLPIASRLFKTEDENTLPMGPGEVLAGDITYLRTDSGFIYLAVVMDIFTRKIVGWSLSNSLDSALVVRALKSSLYCLGEDVKVIFHSDRGCQYASQLFRDLLNKKHIVPSMSRKGNCYDNAFVESWFKSLKSEWIYRHYSRNENDIRALVFEYIETWYNKKRRHSSLDYFSPEEYEKKSFTS